MTSPRSTLIVVAVAVFLVAIIFGTLFGVAYGLSQVIHVAVAIVVTVLFAVLLLWLLLRLITRLLIFPGSMTYCADMREAECNERFARELQWCITDLARLLVYLKCVSGDFEDVKPEPSEDPEISPRSARAGRSPKPPSFSIRRCRTAVTQLKMLKINFASQLEEGCVQTVQQKRLSSLASEVADLLQRITLASSKGSQSLYSFLDNYDADVDQYSLGTGNDIELAEYLVPGSLTTASVERKGLLIEMKALLGDNVAAVQPSMWSCVRRKRRNASRPVLGTLGFMRAELRCRYMGIPLQVPTSWAWGTCDTLDAMLIPRSGLNPGDDGVMDFSSEVVMLMIGPNAAYFENHAVHSDILQLYLDLGFSVFLFNYRGYGRSTGTPTAWKLANDGESVIHFLKSRFNVRRFAVHGRSMGGYVASHIASKFGEVELIIADRTFSSLISTASSAMGWWAAVALAFVLAFASSVRNFMSRSDCYKVLISDPQDNVISDAVSLRTRVARQLLDGVHPRGGHCAVSPNVFKTFLVAWDSLLSQCTQGVSSEQEAGGTTLRQGDSVYWVHANSDVPEGTLGLVEDTEEDETLQGAWVTFPFGKKRFFRADELMKVVGLNRYAAECLAAVGCLDAGGLSIRSAFSSHMLRRLNLSRAAVLRFWLDNLLVWGSRLARTQRAIMAWKVRRDSVAAATGGGKVSTVSRDSQVTVSAGMIGNFPPGDQSQGLMGTVLRFWDLSSFYCSDCGLGMASAAALERHREAQCGGGRSPAALVVDERVECKNPGCDWQVGTVKSVDPLEVITDDPTIRNQSWADVRRILKGTLTADDIHEFCIEEGAYEVAKASVTLHAKAEELAGYLKDNPSVASRGKEVLTHVQALQAFLGQLVRHFETSSFPRSENVSRTGRLVHCTCGHSGRLNRFALEQLLMHIRESGIIPQSTAASAAAAAQAAAKATAAADASCWSDGSMPPTLSSFSSNGSANGRG
eukprot:TRINITY_DN17439_c0_g1_i1.p1 TRINITY_DN17439_c0_g1~~TRINITY_DN17439_c0_g1_i1.p1  ORF type:complete len:975 (+),score=121.72 TRINITY_DN17439_c0_g1_i1:67-2991(+)